MAAISKKSFLGILIAVILLTVGAQIPIEPIPAVDYKVAVSCLAIVTILSGFLLPHPDAFWAYLIYIILGLIGLPVFPDFAAGLETLKGDGNFYLIGGIVAVYLVSSLAQKGWNANFWMILATTAFATSIFMAFNFLRIWLGHGMDRALSWTFFPQLPAWMLIVLGCSVLVWLIGRRAQGAGRSV